MGHSALETLTGCARTNVESGTCCFFIIIISEWVFLEHHFVVVPAVCILTLVETRPGLSGVRCTVLHIYVH